MSHVTQREHLTQTDLIQVTTKKTCFLRLAKANVSGIHIHPGVRSCKIFISWCDSLDQSLPFPANYLIVVEHQAPEFYTMTL